MRSLYRKYRPRSLDEVVGQSSVIELLKASLAAGQTSHAYLLAGPHGVGKTSIARILAHEINQLEYKDDAEYLDIIEIDAASNNGVDDIRDLRERVRIAPAHSAKKIYIIDEVHMLSKSAFNALLKTLEEPPEHVVFILATTEPDRLPETIISRVQRYNFQKIAETDIIKHLRMIADKESIAIEDDALELIANYGKGSFRDSISVLDQVRHLTNSHSVTADNIRSTLGIASDKLIDRILKSRRENNLADLIATINTLKAQGTAVDSCIDQLTAKVHASLVDHPTEIELLDGLLDVASSPYPYLKLLSVLASTLPVSETPKPKPTKPAAPKQTLAQTATVDKITIEPPVKLAPKAHVKTKSLAFDWPKFLAAINSQSGALHALLAKAGYERSAQKLTIYTGSGFAAKKLDSGKYRQIVTAIALDFGLDSDDIAISPDKKPLSDEQSAAVAAIMGGGEEVELDAN